MAPKRAANEADPDTSHGSAPLSSALEQALDDLIIANHALAIEHVLDGFGHVSVRHPANPGRFILSQSRGPRFVSRDDLMEYTLEGEAVDFKGQPLYSERPIHGAIYEARPDVMAVCHNHAPAVIPFGVSALRLQPLFHMAALMGADVPVWDIAEEFPDTDLLVRTMEQGRSLARALGSRRVVLMRGHGCAIAGRSIPEVVIASVYLQINAQLQLQLRGMDGVRYLSADEIERCTGMLMGERPTNKAWDYWRSLVTQQPPPQC